jgi:hypothetical protein
MSADAPSFLAGGHHPQDADAGFPQDVAKDAGELGFDAFQDRLNPDRLRHRGQGAGMRRLHMSNPAP